MEYAVGEYGRHENEEKAMKITKEEDKTRNEED